MSQIRRLKVKAQKFPYPYPQPFAESSPNFGGKIGPNVIFNLQPWNFWGYPSVCIDTFFISNRLQETIHNDMFLLLLSLCFAATFAVQNTQLSIEFVVVIVVFFLFFSQTTCFRCMLMSTLFHSIHLQCPAKIVQLSILLLYDFVLPIEQ